KASDALAVLKTAVGSRVCSLCICDVDRSGKTTASDALLTLKFAVGQPVKLACVACPVHAVIGAAGGSITSADDRLEVEIPAGALTTSTDVTLSGLAPSKRNPATADLAISDVYVLEPDGLALSKPATIHLTGDVTTTP